MKIKNNLTFLTLFACVAHIPSFTSSGEPRMEAPRIDTSPAGENGATAGAREHEQQEERSREQKAAEALRLRNLKTDHLDPSPLPNAPHQTLTTVLPPDDGTTTSAPVTTVTGEEASGLTGISADGIEAIKKIGRGVFEFSRPSPIENESSENKTVRETMEKTLTLMRLFQKELQNKEEKIPAHERLKADEIAQLKTILRNIIRENPNDLDAIQAKMSELLQKVPDSPKNKPAPVEKPTQEKEPVPKEEPAQPKTSFTPEQQKIIDDAIERGKASPEFALTKQILSDFVQKAQKETSLPLEDILPLTRELGKVVTQDPHDSSAIEQEEAELLKKADALNTTKEDAEKTAKNEKVAQERAAQEKAAHEVFEAARIKVLKERLIKSFEKLILNRKYLTLEETLRFNKEFEAIVSKNPNDTDAIQSKSTELLQEANRLNKPRLLAAKKALDEGVEQARLEFERQKQAQDPQPAITPKTNPVKKKPWHKRLLETIKKVFKSPRKTN